MTPTIRVLLVVALIALTASTATGFTMCWAAQSDLAETEQDLAETERRLQQVSAELEEARGQLAQAEEPTEAAPDSSGQQYSEAFRTAFMESCVSSSGGEEAYCQCALDHLEANGPEDEQDITASDQEAAIQACLGEVSG